MSRTHHWIVIVTGVLLLLGPALFERASLWGSGLVASAEAMEEIPSRRERLRAQLLDWNPQLGYPRADRIASAVLRCEGEQGLDPELVLRIMRTESSMRPHVRSPKGAVGLMQVMPHMFERLDMPGNVAHIESNIEAGCMLLADNIRRLGEDRGISAYFWGSRIRGDGYLRRVRSVPLDLDLHLADPVPAP